MSTNIMEWLEKLWAKHENIDPLAHKIINSSIKGISRDAEHLGHATGWDWLAEEGRQNKENPNRGAARGAVGTAAVFAAPYAYAALGGGGTTAAGAAGSALSNGGMFAASEGTQQALAQQAIKAELERIAAEKALKSGVSAGGMFAQAPAVAEQSVRSQIFGGPSMMGPGGVPAAPGMEGLAAKDAVNLGYKAGQMDFPTYLKERAKVELMNLDQPGEWATRFNRNVDRFAGNAGKNMAMNALTPKQQPQQAPMMPRQQAQIPEQRTAEGGSDMQKILADFKAGRITEQELRRKLEALGVRA